MSSTAWKPESSRGGSSGSVSVTDGSTTVNPATEIDFTGGATVTDGGSGVAQVAVTGGAPAPGAVRFASMQFTEPATANTYPITAVAVDPANTFTIAGNHAAQFSAAGASFSVSGSTGNDAVYTVASAVFGAGSTVITTNEAVNDPTADGDILVAAAFSLTATLPVAAGERVLDYSIRSLAGPWTFPGFSLTLGDTAHPGGFINHTYTPPAGTGAAYDPTVNDTATAAAGSQDSWTSDYSYQNFGIGGGSTEGGVPYATADTITATVSQIGGGGGGGSFLIVVMIQAAVTPVVAA